MKNQHRLLLLRSPPVDRTQVSSYVPDPAIVPRPQRRPVPADTGVQIALASGKRTGR